MWWAFQRNEMCGAMQLLSLDRFCCCTEGTVSTRWTVHVLQNSSGNWERSTYHYINLGGSFGKPVLTSFCLGLPFCKMWLVGFPTAGDSCECFQNTFESHLWQALQLCEVFYYFVLHAASSPHSLQADVVMVKEPCQRAFGGSLEASAGNMIQFLCISRSCSDATVPQLDSSCCLGTVGCV